MERFTLKISGTKKIPVEQLFPHEEKGFHPDTEEISDVLDGISITELIENYNLFEYIKIKLIDTHLGFEWELSGFGWKLLSPVGEDNAT
jgi:hypothetical protein